MSHLVVREPLGERRFSAAEFPIAVGGAGSTIVMAGRPEGTEAYLGLHEDQLFVQPADGAELLYNGAPVRSSTWLHPGDVVNLGAARLRVTREDQRLIEVDDGSGGNITAPPILPADARLHGESAAESERIDAVRFRASEHRGARRGLSLNPVRLLLGVAALAVAAVLWFIFTATSISVRTVPEAAQVRMDGAGPAVRLGDRVLLRPGDYSIRAEQEGYEPARLDVQVTDAPNQQFSLELAKLPGRLRIEVPAPARISVDGKELERVPEELELTAGRHTIAIAAERYQPFTARVDVEGAGKTQTFAAELVPAWAEVTVTSEPAGAELLVDGEPRGLTPVTAEIVEGNHPLELRLEGFKPWTTDVQVKANEPLALGPVKLGLPDGRVTLRSEPSGASVSVAGIYRGRTPVALELRPDIRHSVVLTSPGYEAASREITLAAGESRTLQVPLSGVYGEVAVRAEPADAQLYVNGKPHGAANQKLRLVATTHELEIRKAGFVSFKSSVTPRPGVEQRVDAKLLTAEQARLAATPAEVVSKAGQRLKLMPIGRYTMGSPRREPGRRANEAQREVELKRAFYLGLTEVTNAQFRQFKREHRSGIVGRHTLDLDNQPVVGVSWEEAALYCNWLSEQDGLAPAYEKKGGAVVPVKPMTAGYRLPTDAEWEWGARREAPGRLRRYAWGQELPVQPRAGNYADASARLILQDVIVEYEDGFAVSAPVGRFGTNPLGLMDMGGNVAEWAHDYYTVTGESREPLVDPMGPAEGRQHVIRGSSWRHSSATDLRLSARDFGDGARNDVGFRLARYAE